MRAQLLIVDDEVEIQQLLSRHLRYSGHDVMTASTGEAALERLSETRTDVVVSDIQMPGMSGVDLLRRIRRDFPMTRVIMMTGHVTQANILACMRLGAETCIFKPIESLDELDAAINQAVRTIRRWWEILAELNVRKSDASSNSNADA